MKYAQSESGRRGRLQPSFALRSMVGLAAAFLLMVPACLSQTTQADSPQSGQGEVISQAMKRDAARLAARRRVFEAAGSMGEVQLEHGVPWIDLNHGWPGEATQGRLSISSESANTPRQGIKLSGWWTVEVKNPDGTVAAHKEFENSLDSSGQQFLAFLLAGKLAVGEPMINLGNSSSRTGSPCISSNACELYVNPNGVWALNCKQSGDAGSCFSGLGTSLTNIGIDNSSQTVTALQFSGQILADQNGTISQVTTYFAECTDTGVTASISSPTTSANPATCVTSPGTYNSSFTFVALTQASLNPDSGAISVNAGQTVSVSVALGFFSYNF